MSVDLSSESIEGTSTQQFCVEMMKRLDIQRRNERFCDVILEVGSGDDQARLTAHRIVLCAASPFFHNALNSDMKEKEERVIRLEGMSKAVMEEILEYLYSGHVDINERNACDLMAVADYFLLPGLKSLCASVIIDSLSVSNCLEVCHLAARFQCPEVKTKAKDFILANFSSVMQLEGFLKLDKKVLAELISSDEIRVKGEEDVFQVIVKWMEGNEMGESEKFCELFCFVRLVYLPCSYICDVILPYPRVKNCEMCSTLAKNALRELSDGSQECLFTHSTRTCLKTHENCIVALGRRHTFCYVPLENKWYKLPRRRGGRAIRAMEACHGKLYVVKRNSTSARLCTIEQYDPTANTWTVTKSTSGVIPNLYNITKTCVVTFHGFLYCVGGMESETEPTNRVFKYNPVTNFWQDVAPMSIARSSVCAVAGGNFLYAAGGESADSECLDVVEKFDPHRNCWHRVASTLERKMFSGGAFVGGRVFLFGGVTNGRSVSSLIEMYDPGTNVWSSIDSVGAPRITMQAASFKEDAVVIGMWGPEFALECLMQVYNVEKNEWRPCPVIIHRDSSFLFAFAPLRIPRVTLDACEVVSET